MMPTLTAERKSCFTRDVRRSDQAGTVSPFETEKAALSDGLFA